MVFVSVSEHNSANFIAVCGEIGYIGYYEVHSGHVPVGKRTAAINDNNIVPELESGHIFSDFTHTPKEHDLERGFFSVIGSLQIILPQ